MHMRELQSYQLKCIPYQQEEAELATCEIMNGDSVYIENAWIRQADGTGAAKSQRQWLAFRKQTYFLLWSYYCHTVPLPLDTSCSYDFMLVTLNIKWKGGTKGQEICLPVAYFSMWDFRNIKLNPIQTCLLISVNHNGNYIVFHI